MVFVDPLPAYHVIEVKRLSVNDCLLYMLTCTGKTHDTGDKTVM